jgi:hypothetical protein
MYSEEHFCATLKRSDFATMLLTTSIRADRGPARSADLRLRGKDSGPMRPPMGTGSADFEHATPRFF